MRKYIMSLLIKIILPGYHLAKNPPKGKKKGRGMLFSHGEEIPFAYSESAPIPEDVYGSTWEKDQKLCNERKVNDQR